MSQRLKPKRSNVVGKIPTTTDLEIGEIAVNMADKKIFVHEPGGTVVDLTEKADLTGYATETFVTDQGYLTAHQDITGKADVATTISGYGIADAYTKTEVDALIPTIPASYGDTEVNGHLNQSSAGPNQMLIWNGGDYDWIDQPTGGTGGGTSDQFIEGGHSATIYGIDDLVIDAGGSA
jgi:hypothetical protein